MSWASIITWVALIFSVTCFVLFVMDATKKTKPEEVVDRVATSVAERAPGLDSKALGELAKALGAAFSKIGPGLVALIGSILFLLLAGEAAQVYHLTDNGSAESEADAEDDGDGDDADEAGNEADDAGNEANESVNGSDDSLGNEAGGNAT